MTQHEQYLAGQHSMIAIGIVVGLILIFAIIENRIAKKAHKQNLKDLDDRYKYPKY